MVEIPQKRNVGSHVFGECRSCELLTEDSILVGKGEAIELVDKCTNDTGEAACSCAFGRRQLGHWPAFAVR